MKPTAALFRFHLGSGVRLAMRTGIPAAALLTVAVGLSGAPEAVLSYAASDLAGPAGSLSTVLLFTLIGAGIAAWGAPRVGHGVDGWIRHLPARAAAHGLGLLGALIAAQAPVAVAWVALWGMAWWTGVDVDPRRLAELPIVLAGVACAFLPGQRRGLLAVLGVVTVGLALLGGWPGIVCGALVAFGATFLYVPARPARQAGLLWHTTARARLIPELIASRAVGWRVLGAWGPALFLLGAAMLVYENNPEFDTGKPLRLVGTCTVAVIVAGLADVLAVRRPPWRWARSLPWSAADRVRHDATWLAAHAVSAPLVFAVLLDPGVGLAVMLTVPLLAVRAAAAVRGHHTGVGVYALVVGQGVFLGLCMILSPWVALFALLSTWPAWLDAARRDRDLDISRWSPREHLAVGDPGSWRGG